MKKINKLFSIFLLLLILTISNVNYGNTNIIVTKNDTKETSNLEKSATPRKLTNLAIFIDFDKDSTKVPHPLDDEQSVMNAYKIFNSDYFEMQTVNGTISVSSFKKYYENESYGALSITTEILPKKDNKVSSYRAPQPLGYYLKYSDSNPLGYVDRTDALKREKELVESAVSYISAQVATLNLNPNDLDTDGDGNIDAISFIIEGQKNLPTSIAWGDLLWSHMSSSTNIEKTILGKKVSAYTVLYAEDYTETTGLFSLDRGTYGTIIHEFGHVLGYKDLYRYNDSFSKPVGFYDIMGNTVGSNPQHFLTYFTTEYNNSAAWHAPLRTIDKTTENVTIYKPKFIDKNEERAVKLLIDGVPNQFFIVEYHEKQNTYASYSADESGIIIYRVNEDNKFLGNTDGTNNGQYEHVYVFRPQESTLGGGKGNLSQATLNMSRPSFGKDLDLNNTSFDGESLFLSNGANTGIKLQVTNETSDSITFTVTYPHHEGTGTIDDPYIISDAKTFVHMMSLNTKGKYYKIAEDLNFESITDYPKINFEGNLDGNGKTIRNIKTLDSGIFDNVGSYQTQASIYNLFVENITTYTRGGNYLGGLANYTENAVIKNVHLKSGTVTNEGNSINSIVATGGFIGNANNTVRIENCSSGLKVKANQTASGFIGINLNARIKDCFSTGTVDSQTKKGGFIGIQYIIDHTYNAPSNVYFDKSLDATLNAVGGYATGLHDLNVLDEASLSKGIIAVSIDQNLKLSKNSFVDFALTTEPNVDLTFRVSFENPNIVEYINDRLIGKTQGSSSIFVDIPVGSENMRLYSNVTVENGTKLLTESEFLILMGLTKKKSYVIGFPLESKVTDIKNKIESIDGVKVTSFKTADGLEINSGLASTGMQFTISLNSTTYEYIIVIKGDVNGDGLIYATDYVKVKNHIMGKSLLTGAYLIAADIDDDNNIYATDYVQIKNHIMGKKPIIQN